LEHLRAKPPVVPAAVQGSVSEGFSRVDVELQFSTEGLPGAPTGPPGVERPPSEGPSIFTAVQDQLGHKLESTKGPVDVLVIDHVERPTPD